MSQPGMTPEPSMTPPPSVMQATMIHPDVHPFQVNIADEALADLRRRITATRFPSKELVADASQGVQLATLQALTRY